MSEVLARAEALTPRIAAAGDAIERERRVPDWLHAVLIEEGFFRLLLPRSIEGAELDPSTFLEVIETIAKADGSTAWCLCQNNVCGLVAGWLSPVSAREVFGKPDAVLAWGPGPARAVAVAGGYRVTGNWSFASGGRHATWLGAHCPVVEADGTPRRDAAGVPEVRTLLWPAAATPLSDIWQVVGLRATASDAYTATDLFVPDALTLLRDDAATRREAGPLYVMTTNALFAAGFAGVALGLARSLLDATTALAREKTPRGAARTLSQSALLQAEIATAEARLRGARAYLYATVGEVWSEVRRGLRLTLDQRMAIRLASSHALSEAVQVADIAYHAAGATAIFERQPFERRFRDIHTLAQQVQARRAHFETVGRYLLGLDGDLQFV